MNQQWVHWLVTMKFYSGIQKTYLCCKGNNNKGTWSVSTKCKFVINRLSVQYWLNVMKQDWGDQIDPTINGRGRSVLIWGQTCRTLLENEGKPISGDKGTHTDENDPNIWQERMARVWTDVYAYDFGRSSFGRAVSSKWIILQKIRPRIVFVRSDHSLW